MTNRRTVPAGLAIVVLCAAATTACASMAGGTSAPSSGNSSAPSSGISASVPAPPETPSTSMSTSASASTATLAATCAAGQLTVRSDGSGAATGHYELLLEITNTGTATCTLSGFPTVSGTLRSGAVVRGVDTDSVFIGMVNPESAPSPVSLAPGAEAWVPLNLADNPVNGATSCPTFSSFTVTPPGVDRAFTVQAPGGEGAPLDCAGIRVPPVLSAADTVIPSSG